MPNVDPIITPSSNSVTPVGMTNEDRIERLYGSLGLGNILDDVSGAVEDRVLDQFISDAEQTVIIRIGRFFTSSAMSNSDWVCSRVTWIASYFVSKRRGNEHYFESLYDLAMRELDAIATGEIPPPVDIPLRTDNLPSMSNLVVDDRFYSAKIRVKDFVSVGSSSPNRHSSFYGDLYGWL